MLFVYKRVTRRNRQIVVLQNLVIHLRGVGNSRSRFMTGRALESRSAAGRSLPRREIETTGVRWQPTGRVIVGAEPHRRRRSPGMRFRAKRREKEGLRENGTNGSMRITPQSKAEETSKGLEGGMETGKGRALGRSSAARVRCHQVGSNGKIRPTGACACVPEGGVR
jgi:hypothetical protein